MEHPMLAHTTQPPTPSFPTFRPAPATWRVMKLGGTTVADAAALRAACERAKRLVQRQAGRKRVAVVVSALAGVTDSLARLTKASDPDLLDALAVRHLDHLDALAFAAGPEAALRLSLLRPVIAEEIQSLGALLRAAGRAARTAVGTHDLVLSMGERLSARIVHALLADAGAERVDAASLLVARGTAADPPSDGLPDVDTSRRRVRGHLATCRAPMWVVPGYFAHDDQRRLRLLGRGGSDTSATLLGAALGADRVEIWTDVDGVYDSDPRRDGSARRFDVLDYDEAERLAAAGARVLHARSLAPARVAGVPIVVRDSFRPERPGTWIGPVHQRVAA